MISSSLPLPSCAGNGSGAFVPPFLHQSAAATSAHTAWGWSSQPRIPPFHARCAPCPRGRAGSQPAGSKKEVLDMGNKMCGDMNVSHGTCAVCGRRLTNPESVRRGVGPVCYRRMNRQDFQKQQEERIEKLRAKAREKYYENVRKYPLREGEVRCENCGRPVLYHEGDGCPGPYCCSPCCPYATISPCPRERKIAVDALAAGKRRQTVEV